MPYKKKVREVMIPLKHYPHIPHWFSLRQPVAMLRESALKYPGALQPRSVLVFNEKYQIVGLLTLRDLLKGLEPGFLKENELVKADPALAVVMGDLFGPGMKKQAERPVSEVMGPIKVSVQADDSLAKALFLMIHENDESAIFVDITCWGRDAEIAAEYLKKGSPVLIEGRLKLDTGEQDGNRRSKLTVTCERLKLIQSRAAQSNGSEEGQRAEAEGPCRSRGGLSWWGR